MTTKSQWHYPATITNSTLAKQIAQFAAGGSFNSPTTAAVINNFGNRQQMVWFTSWGTDCKYWERIFMFFHLFGNGLFPETRLTIFLKDA